MNVYRICEACGAALDPGERCDCRGQDRVELIQPESPYLDGDKSTLACPGCGSGEYLHNADEAESNFCGQCGQPLDWGGEP